MFKADGFSAFRSFNALVSSFFLRSKRTGALVNSVVIACVSSILPQLAVLVAAEAWRRNSKFSRFLVGRLPFLIPGIVLAVSISLLLIFTSWYRSRHHIGTRSAPSRNSPAITQLGLSQIDTEHVDAATLMGLSERETLFRLEVPIVMSCDNGGLVRAYHIDE